MSYKAEVVAEVLACLINPCHEIDNSGVGDAKRRQCDILTAGHKQRVGSGGNLTTTSCLGCTLSQPVKSFALGAPNVV
jgi:hypothetical protein